MSVLLFAFVFSTHSVEAQDNKKSEKAKAKVEKAEKKAKEKAAKKAKAKAEKEAKKRKKKGLPDPAPAPQPIDPYTKVTQGFQKFQGLFTTHINKDGVVLFEIPDTAFNKSYILASRVAETSNNSELVAGQMAKNPILIRFSRDSKRVYMHFVQNSDIVSKDDPIYPSFKKNYKDPIWKVFPILASKGRNVVIDVNSLFLSQDNILSPLSSNPNPQSIKGIFFPPASKVSRVSTFPKNIEVKSVYAYTVPPHNMPYTVTMHRSLFVLPDEPMRHRFQDNRVGFFSTEKRYFSSNKDKITNREIIHRWRIEPKKGEEEKYFAGELVEPAKPIVFYVDTAFPKKWRETVMQGVEDWNKAFEVAGFKNVVKAVEYPRNNPDFDPDDMRYSCIKYALTDIPNAMGPSYVDPRTGEILTADVIWYHNVISLLHNWRFTQTAAVDKRVHKNVFDDEVMKESVRYVASHEIGHTLGLMHNMGASYSFPVDSLRSPSFTQKYGTTPSIMDYARNNFVAQPGDFEKGVKLTPPVLGVYDIHAINWAYRLIKDAKTPEDEIPTLDKWIEEKKHDRMFEFGAQQFPATVDPTAQSEDLGNDHIKSGNYAIKNLKLIMKNFESWKRVNGDKYDEMKGLYREVVNQYGRHIGHVIPYLGGISFKEIRQGDGQKYKNYIDKATQKKAMAWLVKEAKTYNSWLCPQDLLDKLGISRDTYNGYQLGVIYSIFSPTTLFRVWEGEGANKSKNYSVTSYMNDAVNEVFKTTINGGSLTAEDMSLQSTAISVLMNISGLQPAPARAGGVRLMQEYENFVNTVYKTSMPCSHHNCEEHSFARIIMNQPQLSKEKLNPLAAAQLKRISSLYKQGKASGVNQETKNFYDYYILQIDRLFKL